MECYIALDVGGTNIKAGIVDKSGHIVDDIVKTYDAKAKESKESIISNMIYIIKDMVSSTLEKNPLLCGIGFAFPGPFDYGKGISYIKGINKYESLYGTSIKDELTNYISKDEFFKGRLDDYFSILFDNDANLYALGEYHRGKAKGYAKCICLCIGTGLGSAFIEKGHLVKFREDVPQNGWIYNVPFKNSIVDDYISARGILNLSKELSGGSFTGSVKELSENAKAGDTSAIKIFDTLGTWLGDVLLPYIRSFNPEAIILGGQIAKSADLFISSIYASIASYNPVIEISSNSSKSTLKGIYNLFNPI